MLSQRMKELKPSPTLALAAKAKLLQSQGFDIISLTVGEPDWPTYKAAKEAGKKAIDDNKTLYTPASGIAELRKEVAQITSQQLKVQFKDSEVTVGSGAKFIIYAAFAAILDPKDEVIIPSPYWVSYPTMVELAGGVAHIVECGPESQFKLTAELFKKSITPKTKALLLNSPSNPTGAEYNLEELKALAEVLKKNPQIAIISDDIYNQLSFTHKGLSPHILHVAPELKERCISINGMSKAYAMTGWRMGWAAGPELIIKAMGNFQSQTTGAPSSISQWASVAALQHCAQDVKDSLVALKERKDYFIELLSKVKGMEIFKPDGAFYLWVDVRNWVGKTYHNRPLLDSRMISEKLLEDEKLAVVPGLEFGYEGYLRLSFATRKEDLKKAAERFEHFVSQLT